MNEKVKRKYDASGRRARAERTRQDVIEAATDLFVQRGYGATTIADIAVAAQVSPETIYKGFGSKSAVLAAVARAQIRGDADRTPFRQRRVIEEIRLEQDPRRQFLLYGRLLADVQPRLAPIMGVMREAARSDQELDAVLRQLEADRLESMQEFAGLLGHRRALRRGVSAKTAADILWTLNASELFDLLVLRRGWSADRYGRWVADQLTAALLP